MHIIQSQIGDRNDFPIFRSADLLGLIRPLPLRASPFEKIVFLRFLGDFFIGIVGRVRWISAFRHWRRGEIVMDGIRERVQMLQHPSVKCRIEIGKFLVHVCREPVEIAVKQLSTQFWWYLVEMVPLIPQRSSEVGEIFRLHKIDRYSATDSL